LLLLLLLLLLLWRGVGLVGGRGDAEGEANQKKEPSITNK